MAQLPPDLFDAVVKVLNPFMDTVQSRQTELIPLLRDKPVYHHINWQGSSHDFTVHLVEKVSPEELIQALMRLRVGVERREHIASLCAQIEASRSPTEASPQPSIDPVLRARHSLAALGIAINGDSLALQIRSGNVEAVDLLFKAGWLPDIPLREHLPDKPPKEYTPLALALSQVGPETEANPIHVDMVRTIVAAGPRDIASAAHSALAYQEHGRVFALLRAGVPLDCRDQFGQSLAVHAMRQDDDAGSGESASWTELLVKEGILPAAPLATWMLLWAAATGQLSVVRRLLDKGIPVDSTLQGERPPEAVRETECAYWWPGGTALHQLLRRWKEPQSQPSRDALLHLLIEHKASPGVADATGATALHIAASQGLVEATRVLADRRSDLQQRDGEGRTALRLAVGASTEAARLLLERWMPADASERADLLHHAVYQLNTELVDLLLERRCDANLPNQNCPTALFELAYFWGSLGFSSYAERKRITCLDLLLKHGADVSARDDRGWTVLHPMAGFSDIQAVDRLLKAGADPEACDNVGRTPLMNSGTVAVVERLLSAGASATRCDNFGYDALDHMFMRANDAVCQLLSAGVRTPRPEAHLIRAIRSRDAAKVAALLESGVSARTVDGGGRSVLHLAADEQSVPIMTLLLDKGADVNARDLDGDTPLYECLSSKGQTEVSAEERENCITLLLDRGASADKVNAREEAAIFAVPLLWRCLPSVSKRLLAACGTGRNHRGETVVMAAIQYGEVDHVRELLREGLDVKATDEKGRTALHFAARGFAGDFLKGRQDQDVEKARLLRMHGAELEATDRFGDTPLFAAVSGGNGPMIKFLLDSEADSSRRNNAGETIVTVALQRRNYELVNHLLGRQR
jgi:ankyrin repeat protein